MVNSPRFKELRLTYDPFVPFTHGSVADSLYALKQKDR